MTMQPWLTPIEPSDGGAFLRDVVVYANAVAANFRQQVAAQPEDQLKPPVGELLKAIGRIAGRSVEYRTEVRPDDVEGRPDIGITVDGQLIGLVELKAPGVGARPETFTGRNAEQWRRFREYPNLIYTDGLEWSLTRQGEQLAARPRQREWTGLLFPEGGATTSSRMPMRRRSPTRCWLAQFEGAERSYGPGTRMLRVWTASSRRWRRRFGTTRRRESPAAWAGYAKVSPAPTPRDGTSAPRPRPSAARRCARGPLRSSRPRFGSRPQAIAPRPPPAPPA